MRKRSVLFFSGILLAIIASAQTDTIPLYLQTHEIPSFKIQLGDYSWFEKNDLKKKPTLIFYFSPDCGHCQLATEEILGKMKMLEGLQIIMITSRSTDEMKTFSDRYMLQKFPSIKIGSDTERYVTRFFDVKFTPFSALYDKTGKLATVYKDGIGFDDLAARLLKDQN